VALIGTQFERLADPWLEYLRAAGCDAGGDGAAAFARLHVPYHLQNKLMVLLAPMQRDVVEHPTGPPQAAPKAIP
jgi:hypothetical protein